VDQRTHPRSTHPIRVRSCLIPLDTFRLDWCSLWIRGLVVFAEQCAISELAGTAPPSLLEFQHQVVEWTPEELERRFRLAPALVEQFRTAAPHS
jgi:hypothetical protein